MTIDTIKDVLGRIISINKNLTEDSLRNLLVASGWDNNDIEEGLKVYRAYGAKVQSVAPETPVSEVVSTTAPAYAPVPMGSAPHLVYTPTSTPAPEQTESNFIPTPPPFFAPKPVTISTPSLQTSAPISMDQAPSAESLTSQNLPIITTENPKTFSTVALAVDIVLFILTLLLLVYVISQ